jgi:hypothetical protein
MKKNVNAKTIDTVESYTLLNISGATVLGASVNKKINKKAMQKCRENSIR